MRLSARHGTFQALLLLMAAGAASPAWSQAYYGGSIVDDQFSTGEQEFHDGSMLEAQQNALTGGLQQFFNFSMLIARAEGTIAGGTQVFYDNSALILFSDHAITGGIQYFLDDARAAAYQADAVSYGHQEFYGASGLYSYVTDGLSGGEQYFHDNSSLQAVAAAAVSGGNQSFDDTASLIVWTADGVHGGTQTFHGSSVLYPGVAFALSGGTQLFYDTSRLEAAAANAVSGGTQIFYDDSSLKAGARDALSGSYPILYDRSTLEVTAAGALGTSFSYLTDQASLKTLVADAIDGGTQQFDGNSTLVPMVPFAIVGGEQDFFATSALVAQMANTITGGEQYFLEDSSLVATQASAINGGLQTFFDNSSLNASAANAVVGGKQQFTETSTLHALTSGAIAGGEQYFDSGSKLYASAGNAIAGGNQEFADSSILIVNAAGALAGGHQVFRDFSYAEIDAENGMIGGDRLFYGTSTITLAAPRAINGGSQAFYDDSTLNAGVSHSIGQGSVAMHDRSIVSAFDDDAIDQGNLTFFDTSMLYAWMPDAVTGGSQTFQNDSTLRAENTHAVSGGTQTLMDNSSFDVRVNDATTAGASVHFDNANGGQGGRFQLSGRTTTIGQLWSNQPGAGSVVNGDANAGVLTVDGSLRGPSSFSGTIADGGVGGLGLVIAGGTFTLSGQATLSGGTLVSGGKLLVGDATGAGTLDGIVEVANGGTLGGAGHLNGPVTIDGTLSPGNSPGTLTFAQDLTLSATSRSRFELNRPGSIGSTGPADAGGNDLVEVVGTLSLAGTLEAQVAAAGHYRLFDYGTLQAGSAFTTTEVTSSKAGFNLAGYVVRYDVPGQINLAVLGTGQSLQFWDGSDATGNDRIDGGDGVWQDLATNWSDLSGHDMDGWADSVGVFAGTAGTVQVQGSQYFDTLQFASDGYRVEGDPLIIAGATAGILTVDNDVTATIAAPIVDGSATRLEKLGGGTLILSGNNGYSGGTTVAGGVLQVGKDGNLGAPTGGLALDGGTLRVTGTDYDTTSRRIAIGQNGGGIDIANPAHRLILAGDIVGSGDLLKLGAGTLVLKSANSYGDTLVAAGTLEGNAQSIAGNIANAATTVFDQAVDATFAGTIAGLNGTNGQMVKKGGGTLTLAGTSSLDWTIAEGRLRTQAERLAGDVAIDAGGGLLLDHAEGALYAGRFSGTGDIAIGGSGSLLLTGSSDGFTGTTRLTSGTLRVGNAGGQAALGGSLTVLNGATLAGNGSVGSGIGSKVNIAEGGTVAPGNSIGTLAIQGDLTFEGGSTYLVEIGADQASDLLKVAGKATLQGGALVLTNTGATPSLSTTYTILRAQELEGSFDNPASSFAFLEPELINDYDQGEVQLIFKRNGRDFSDPAQTPNEAAAANGIESTGPGQPIFDAIVGLPDDDDLIRRGLNELSGAIHASAKTAMIEDSRFPREAANDRLAAAFQRPAAKTEVRTYGPDGAPMSVPADYAGTAFWLRGFGDWGHNEGNGRTANLDRRTGGLLLGADTDLAGYRLGLLAGYSHATFDTDADRSSGQSDAYHLGLYGGHAWGSLALRSGAFYSRQKLDTDRSVAILDFKDHLRADYVAQTLQAFGELGYAIDAGRYTQIEPFANVAHVKLRTDGFREHGGAAALEGRSSDTDTSFMTLGLRGQQSWPVGSGTLGLNGMLGWRRALGDTHPDTDLAFASGDRFGITGVPVAKDSAILAGGIDLQLKPGLTFGLTYQGQLASSAQDHGFTANLAIDF